MTVNGKSADRVLIIGPGLKTEGGVTTVIARIFAELKKSSEYDVRWVASHRSGSIPVKIGQAIIGFLHAAWLIPPAKLIHIHSAAGVSFVRKSMFLWLAKLWRKPVIWHLHSPELDFKDFYGRQDWVGRYARFVLRQCKRIVVLSDRWVEIAATCLPADKIRVIYNPIPEMLDSDIPMARVDDRILYLAHLIPRKGYSYLIRAFAEVQSAFPRARLVFAGSGEVKQAQALCRELDIENRVEFLGWIGEPERTRELEKASIFVLPSFQEGLPMGVLEAMAFGLAVITTPVGGIADVVKNEQNGLLVNPGDAGEIAKSLQRLLADRDRVRKLGDAAAQSVSRYEPAKLAREWKMTYSDVLKPRASCADSPLET